MERRTESESSFILGRLFRWLKHEQSCRMPFTSRRPGRETLSVTSLIITRRASY